MVKKAVVLNVKFMVQVKPKAPFNFDATMHKPSHFPAPVEDYVEGVYWQTMRFGGKALGLKMENKGTIDNPTIRLTFFSKVPLTKKETTEIVKEIRWRFDFDSDLSQFSARFENDNLLGPVLQKWRGMHVSCGNSLYELLIISIVLQNATVRRTVQMIKALLDKYGTKVKFDGKELYSFWEPKRLQRATEQELRELKVGYRAKYLKKTSEDFVMGVADELKLRQMSMEKAKKELDKLYGVGPASASILLFEALHHYDTIDKIGPWEQQIYSRLLFNKELLPAETILKEIDKRYGKWKTLAMHYVFEDLFWKRKTQKIEWLEKLIRL
jgi:3-methyladenine DNA glycosylase/8-oxoguanine DNA glycosylase